MTGYNLTFWGLTINISRRGIDWPFYFANTRNDQICLASSEHFVNSVLLKLTGIPFYLNVRLIFIVVT